MPTQENEGGSQSQPDADNFDLSEFMPETEAQPVDEGAPPANEQDMLPPEPEPLPFDHLPETKEELDMWSAWRDAKDARAKAIRNMINKARKDSNG